jgi:hypothetical protein
VSSTSDTSDTSDIEDRLRARQRVSDSSEHKHIIDFLLDVVDQVHYDIDCGYPYTTERDVLRRQLLNTLDEFTESCAALKTLIEKELKP